MWEQVLYVDTMLWLKVGDPVVEFNVVGDSMDGLAELGKQLGKPRERPRGANVL